VAAGTRFGAEKTAVPAKKAVMSPADKQRWFPLLIICSTEHPQRPDSGTIFDELWHTVAVNIPPALPVVFIASD